MADNVQLNPGVGGAELAALQDATGRYWPTATIAFATTISDGANVVQVVDATHGLPVAVVGGVNASQADEAALNATVFQGGLWTTAVSGSVAATQSGAWTVGLSAGAEVKLAAGSTTAVSGTVAATQSGTWTVDLGTGATINLDPDAEIKIGAGANLIGKVAAGVDGSTIYDGATALQPRFAKISASASGDNTIVAAVAGSKIRVLRWGLTANGDVAAKWRSGVSDVTGPRPLTQYASAGGAYCPVGCFETATDAPLVLNLSDAVAVGGELTYVLIP